MTRIDAWQIQDLSPKQVILAIEWLGKEPGSSAIIWFEGHIYALRNKCFSDSDSCSNDVCVVLRILSHLYAFSLR